MTLWLKLNVGPSISDFGGKTLGLAHISHFADDTVWAVKGGCSEYPLLHYRSQVVFFWKKQIHPVEKIVKQDWGVAGCKTAR